MQQASLAHSGSRPTSPLKPFSPSAPSPSTLAMLSLLRASYSCGITPRSTSAPFLLPSQGFFRRSLQSLRSAGSVSLSLCLPCWKPCRSTSSLGMLGGLPSGCPLSFAPNRLPILSLFPALSYRTSLTLLLLADDTLYRAGPKVPAAASRRRRRT